MRLFRGLGLCFFWGWWLSSPTSHRDTTLSLIPGAWKCSKINKINSINLNGGLHIRQHGEVEKSKIKRLDSSLLFVLASSRHNFLSSILCPPSSIWNHLQAAKRSSAFPPSFSPTCPPFKQHPRLLQAKTKKPTPNDSRLVPSSQALIKKLFPPLPPFRHCIRFFTSSQRIIRKLGRNNFCLGSIVKIL